jgi:hypothetical protein
MPATDIWTLRQAPCTPWATSRKQSGTTWRSTLPSGVWGARRRSDGGDPLDGAELRAGPVDQLPLAGVVVVAEDDDGLGRCLARVSQTDAQKDIGWTLELRFGHGI